MVNTLQLRDGVGVGKISPTKAPTPTPEKRSTQTDFNSGLDSHSAALAATLRSRAIDLRSEGSCLVFFFDPANFKPMADNGTGCALGSGKCWDHMLTAAPPSQRLLILIQYISHLGLPHAKIWQRYIQQYAYGKRSKMLRTHARRLRF